MPRSGRQSGQEPTANNPVELKSLIKPAKPARHLRYTPTREERHTIECLMASVAALFCIIDLNGATLSLALLKQLLKTALLEMKEDRRLTYLEQWHLFIAGLPRRVTRFPATTRCQKAVKYIDNFQLKDRRGRPKRPNDVPIYQNGVNLKPVLLHGKIFAEISLLLRSIETLTILHLRNRSHAVFVIELTKQILLTGLGRMKPHLRLTYITEWRHLLCRLVPLQPGHTQSMTKDELRRLLRSALEGIESFKLSDRRGQNKDREMPEGATGLMLKDGEQWYVRVQYLRVQYLRPFDQARVFEKKVAALKSVVPQPFTKEDVHRLFPEVPMRVMENWWSEGGGRQRRGPTHSEVIVLIAANYVGYVATVANIRNLQRRLQMSKLLSRSNLF